MEDLRDIAIYLRIAKVDRNWIFNSTNVLGYTKSSIFLPHTDLPEYDLNLCTTAMIKMTPPKEEIIGQSFIGWYAKIQTPDMSECTIRRTEKQTVLFFGDEAKKPPHFIPYQKVERSSNIQLI